MNRASLRIPIVSWLLPALLVLANCTAARTTELEIQRIRDALELRPGMHVADVGAGDGEWSEALAEQVGPSGRVYATEVDEEDVETIQRRVEDASNVTVILGDGESTGLPDACCDAVLLRLVYHHFTDPDRMRVDLRRALRPGGRVVVVEITPQKGWARLDGVPERDGHGITPEDLLAEMESGGWVAVERHDDWGSEDDHYCIVFR